MKDLYVSNVSVTGGRDGSARSSDGRLDLRLGFPKELGGAGDAANAEQLFVAGYAACFATTLKGVAAARGVSAGQIVIEAEGVLSLRDDGAYAISRVRLTVRALPLGDAADAIVAEARRVCAYSNATRGNVETEVVLA